MKWVVGAFLVFGVVATGAYLATEPVVDADETVVVGAGEEAVLDLSVRNTGTVHAEVVGTGDDATVPRVRLPDGASTTSATAAVPASGEVEPRLILEVPEDVEPGEYRLRLEAWRLPNRMGERTVTEVTVVVEEG
jgi:uncharacterized membrane protein